MARSNARASIERTEREIQADTNAAIADTEAEISEFAMSDEDPDDAEPDGDRSLEEMDDHPANDDDESEDGEDEEGDEEDPDGSDDDDADDADGADDDDEAPAGRQDEQRDARQRDRYDDDRDDRGRVPAGRLREESERRRAAEERQMELERRLLEQNGRLEELSRRVNAPPAQPQLTPEQRRQQEEAADPRPDMFLEPEKYEQWVFRQAEKRAEQRFQQGMTAYQQEQFAREAERVESAIRYAATEGPRAMEVDPAYRLLLNYCQQNPREGGVIARRLIAAGDDAANVLLQFWDDNGGQEWREDMIARLSGEDPRDRRGRQEDGDRRDNRTRGGRYDDDPRSPNYNDTRPSNGRGQSREQSRRDDGPRHETRIPSSLRRNPPSLNAARGGGNQRIANPAMYDNSEASVAAYAFADE